jgi:DNA mismatch endonuclease (patch repair protein)
MRYERTTPSFDGLHPASEKATAAARGASTKSNTRCELVLRRELWRRGLRYRLNHPGLVGRPDIVFTKQRVVVFCDGDFWHGRDLDKRLLKLAKGHNATYWLAKLQRNLERDSRQTGALEASGWMVLRFWETDIIRRANHVADQIFALLRQRPHARHVTPASSAPSSCTGV